MRRLGHLIAVSASALAFSSFGVRAEAESAAPKYIGSLPFIWTGLYVGYQMGGASGHSDVSDPFGPSIFGDNISTPGPLAGGVVGFNWQKESAVVGVEADANWADLIGTNSCFAFSGFFVGANCRSHTDAFGTLTGRLGYATGPEGRTLLYVKGGAAWENNSLDATTAGGFAIPTTSTSGARWGWTLGTGAEQALTGNWSVKAEYDYLAFGNTNIMTPLSGYQTPPYPQSLNFNLVPGVAAMTSQDIHEIKVGLNYRFGVAPISADDGWSSGSLKDGSFPSLFGSELELGTRYVHGWGRFQKDLGIQGQGMNNLASRLTYNGMETNGGELFARLDLKNNVMVKGLLGSGDSGGHMNDEDWAISFSPTDNVPYSNTLSDVGNKINYGTIDAGYDWLRGQGYKVASFVGYNILEQNMKALGCTQVANQFSDCVSPLPTSVLAITEHDTWQSVRFGTAADFMLTPRVQVNADAAYLPYVWFNGTDNHVLRSLVLPEDGNGQGVELDLMASYAITDQFSVGVGGRYWAMWTTSGETNFTGVLVPQRFADEQAAIMAQASYKLGDGCCMAPLK